MDGGPLLRAHVARRIAYHITRESYMAEAKLDEYKRVMRHSRYHKTEPAFCDQCEIPYIGEADMEWCNMIHKHSQTLCEKSLWCGRQWCNAQTVPRCHTCASYVCGWEKWDNTCVCCNSTACDACIEADQPDCCDLPVCPSCKTPSVAGVCDRCVILNELEQQYHERNEHDASVSSYDCHECASHYINPDVPTVVAMAKKRRKINSGP